MNTENNLEDYFSSEQLQVIAAIICEQVAKYRKCATTDLFLPEYAPHKQDRSIHHAIESGFPPDSLVVPGFKVRVLNYAKGFVKPELYSAGEKVIAHIHSQNADMKAAYLKEYYAKNINCKRPVYFYFRYRIKSDEVIKIELICPSEEGDMQITVPLKM
jgi:hypothetical protein